MTTYSDVWIPIRMHSKVFSYDSPDTREFIKVTSTFHDSFNKIVGTSFTYTDGQKEGSFDRVIGLVYCGNDNINNKKSLNQLLLEGGYAVIYQDFCGVSEFSSAGWAQSRGTLVIITIVYKGLTS